MYGSTDSGRQPEAFGIAAFSSAFPVFRSRAGFFRESGETGVSVSICCYGPGGY